MGVSNLNFAKQIESWIGATVKDIIEVFHESTSDVVDEMQKIGPSTAFPSGQGGRMPVDTGWLRASIRVSTGGMPSIDPSSYPPDGTAENSIAYDKGAVDTAINAAPLGSKLSIGYTAAYANEQEYGSGKSKARAFARTAALMWPNLVNRAVERVKRK